MPLDAPVINAARSATWLSFARRRVAGTLYRPSITWPDAPGSDLPSLSPACSRRGLLVAGCGSSDDSTTGSSGSAESRPAPPKSEFPAAEGSTLAEVLEADRTVRTRRLAGGDGLLQGENRFPFGVFDKGGAPVTDAEVALYFAKVPEVNEKAEKENAKGAAARAQEQSPRRTGRRARSRRGSKRWRPSPPSGRRRRATTPTRHQSVYSTDDRLPQQRRVADRRP